jgi:hypothetical protein
VQDRDIRVQRRRRRTFPRPILDRIEELHLVEGKFPSEIYSTIEQEFSKEYADRPAERTVKDIVKDLGPRPDPSAAWTLQTAPTRELGPAIEVLRVVVSETRGARTFVTQGEARLLAQIYEAAPGIDPARAFDLARRFDRAEPTWEATASLHHYLAFRPWESRAAQEKYEAASGIEKLAFGRASITGKGSMTATGVKKEMER